MANKILLSFLMVLVILSGSFYMVFSDKIRIDFAKTRTSYKLYNPFTGKFDDLQAVEYTRIFDGTTLMRAKSRFIRYNIIGDTTEWYRYALFKEGIVAEDFLEFDNLATNVEDVPVFHKVCFGNAKGKIFEYLITNIEYTGETRKITSPFKFGKNMKVTFQDGYHLAKVVNNKVRPDKIQVRYRITSDNQCFNVRLFDPTPTSIAGKPSIYDNWNSAVYEDGLVAFYRFDNESAVGENDTHVYDWSGGEENGTIIGARYNLTNKVLGDGAMQFDGINDRVIINNYPDHPLTNWSIFAWVNVSILAIRNSVISDSFFGDTGYRLTLNNDDVVYEIGNGTATLGTTFTVSSLLNEWHFVGMTYKDDIIIGYFDGVNVTTTSAPDLAQSTDELKIGISAFNLWDFNGVIDEVLIYNESLSKKVILDIYTQQKDDCVIPFEDMSVISDTTLCPGIYLLNDTNLNGIIKIGANVALDCNGASLTGNSTTNSIAINISSYNNTIIQNCTLFGYDIDYLISDVINLSISKNNYPSGTSYIKVNLNPVNFTVNETSTNYHLINLSNNGTIRFSYNGRKDFRVENTTTTINDMPTQINQLFNGTTELSTASNFDTYTGNIPANNRTLVFSYITATQPQFKAINSSITNIQYIYDPQSYSLKLNITGVGNLTVKNLTELARGDDGNYTVTFNGDYITSQSSDTYTTTDVGFWTFIPNINFTFGLCTGATMTIIPTNYSSKNVTPATQDVDSCTLNVTNTGFNNFTFSLKTAFELLDYRQIFIESFSRMFGWDYFIQDSNNHSNRTQFNHTMRCLDFQPLLINVTNESVVGRIKYDFGFIKELQYSNNVSNDTLINTTFFDCNITHNYMVLNFSNTTSLHNYINLSDTDTLSLDILPLNITNNIYWLSVVYVNDTEINGSGIVMDSIEWKRMVVSYDDFNASFKEIRLYINNTGVDNGTAYVDNLLSNSSTAITRMNMRVNTLDDPDNSTILTHTAYKELFNVSINGSQGIWIWINYDKPQFGQRIFLEYNATVVV